MGLWEKLFSLSGVGGFVCQWLLRSIFPQHLDMLHIHVYFMEYSLSLSPNHS